MANGGICWFYWLHSGRQKHFLSWTLTFQGHRNSESISDIIPEYLFQHGKSYTRQDLQYTAQERKDYGNFTDVKSRFYLVIVWAAQRKRPDDNQCFHHVRAVYQTQTTMTWCSYSRPDTTHRELMFA